MVYVRGHIEYSYTMIINTYIRRLFFIDRSQCVFCSFTRKMQLSRLPPSAVEYCAAAGKQSTPNITMISHVKLFSLRAVCTPFSVVCLFCYALCNYWCVCTCNSRRLFQLQNFSLSCKWMIQAGLGSITDTCIVYIRIKDTIISCI